MSKARNWMVAATAVMVTTSQVGLAQVATGSDKPAAPGQSAAASVPDVSTDKSQAPPQDDSVSLERVVVTAQRRSQDAQDVPITIQTFNAQTIKDLDIKSSTDIGQLTPNVDIALPSGAGAQPIITIRGIGLNDFNSNNAGPNGVYVDEVYLSSPGSQTFQTFDLDRIEVLKGPQGTLYGRNTSGGAINFITAKPASELEADLTAGYGSFNTVNLEGALGGALADGLNGRLSFVRNTSDGYFHNLLTGNREDGSNDYAVRAQLEWRPNAELKILANLHGGEVDTRPTEYRHIGTLNPKTGQPCSYTQSFDGNCVDAFGYGTPSNFYDGAFNRQQDLTIHSAGASLRADYTPGTITFTSLTAFEQNVKFHPEDTDASPNRLLEINYGVRSNTLTQEFRAAQSVGPLNWVAGVYALQEHLYQDQPAAAFIDFDNFYGPGSGDGLAQVAYDRNRQITQSTALFGQTDYELTNRLKLTFGARYTSEKKDFDTVASAKYQSSGLDIFGPVVPLWAFNESVKDSKVSGKAAIDFKVMDGINTYASVSSGFKSADFNGGFLSANPTEAHAQIGPVKPETVLAYELGVKSQFFDRRLQVNAALFYNDYTDIQVFNQIAPVIPGGFDLEILTNAPKAHTEGLDLQILGKPLPNLTATLNLGLLETRIDEWNTSSGTGAAVDYTGHRLPLAPSSSLATILDYKIALSSGAVVNLIADASYKAKQFFDISNDPFIKQQGYWLTNLRSNYSWDESRYEVAAFVQNLFNKHYLSDAINLTNPFGLVQDVVGTPRFVGVEFTYHY